MPTAKQKTDNQIDRDICFEEVARLEKLISDINIAQIEKSTNHKKATHNAESACIISRTSRSKWVTANSEAKQAAKLAKTNPNDINSVESLNKNKIKTIAYAEYTKACANVNIAEKDEQIAYALYTEVHNAFMDANEAYCYADIECDKYKDVYDNDDDYHSYYDNDDE